MIKDTGNGSFAKQWEPIHLPFWTGWNYPDDMVTLGEINQKIQSMVQKSQANHLGYIKPCFHNGIKTTFTSNGEWIPDLWTINSIITIHPDTFRIPPLFRDPTEISSTRRNRPGWVSCRSLQDRTTRVPSRSHRWAYQVEAIRVGMIVTRENWTLKKTWLFRVPRHPNTWWIGVWNPKHLLRKLLRVPNTYSSGIWRILDVYGVYTWMSTEVSNYS